MTTIWSCQTCKNSPANLILMRSKGCRINVDVTPPDIPATRCSYLMWLSRASLEDDELGFFMVVMPKKRDHRENQKALCGDRFHAYVYRLTPSQNSLTKFNLKQASLNIIAFVISPRITFCECEWFSLSNWTWRSVASCIAVSWITFFAIILWWK